MSARYRTLELERRGPAGWLWLARPEARNALDATMLAELARALGVLARDESVRVLVLGGRGSAFCAGGDLERMAREGRASAARNRAQAQQAARLFRALDTFPKPTLARIHGPAVAGGLGLACCCDVLVASDEASFALPEVRLGLLPAIVSPYLVRALGAHALRRYLLSGERFSAQEALRLGMLHEKVPPEQLDVTVERIVQALVAGAPGALAEGKRLMARLQKPAREGALLAHCAEILARRRASDEAREGLAAALEKRKPRWAP